MFVREYTKLVAYPVSFLFGRLWSPLEGEGGSCARARVNLLASGAHSTYVLYPQNRRCPLAFPFVLPCTLQNLGTPAVGYSTKRGPEAVVFVTLAASLHLLLLYTQLTSPSRVSLNTVTSLNTATSPFVRPERALTRKNVDVRAPAQSPRLQVLTTTLLQVWLNKVPTPKKSPMQTVSRARGKSIGPARTRCNTQHRPLTNP